MVSRRNHLYSEKLRGVADLPTHVSVDQHLMTSEHRFQILLEPTEVDPELSTATRLPGRGKRTTGLEGDFALLHAESNKADLPFGGELDLRAYAAATLMMTSESVGVCIATET